MNKTTKILLLVAVSLLLVPSAASAATKLEGSATWTPKPVGKLKLAGKLAVSSGSSYSGNSGSVNFAGTLRSGKISVSGLKLRGQSLNALVAKKRVRLATVTGSTGSLFAFQTNSLARLTKQGAAALRKKGARKARVGRAIGNLRLQGESVHQIRSGTTTITFNATLVNQFRYLVNSASGNFESFAGLAAALPLSGNGVFQTVYASQLAADPAFLDGKIATPLILNPNCVNAAAGSGPDALPNAAGASCAPASGTVSSEIQFPATGGELVGGKKSREFMHDGGLGLQLRLGSFSLPTGGPNYGALTAAAGNGIGGSVLQDPGIDTVSGVDTVGMITSLGRLPIATLPGWGDTLSCSAEADQDGNYTCTASADTLLTPLAAGALSASFGTEIPANTNLGSMATEFKIGS